MKDSSTTAKTPAEYIASLEEPRRSEIKKLDAFIRKSVPSLKLSMMAGMLAYGPMHYKTKSKREGDWFALGLSSRKQYISVYVCAVDEDSYIAENNRERLKGADIGRGCIRFKKTEDIDMDVLKDILKDTEKWWKKLYLPIRWGWIFSV